MIEEDFSENLKLANNILKVLSQEIVLDDDDYIYNDEFYVSVVTNIVPENSFNLQIGETLDQKADNLSKLVEFLSSIVEMDLSHINTNSVIYDRDAQSAKHLLELILELIIILKQDQEPDEENNSQIIHEDSLIQNSMSQSGAKSKQALSNEISRERQQEGNDEFEFDADDDLESKVNEEEEEINESNNQNPREMERERIYEHEKSEDNPEEQENEELEEQDIQDQDIDMDNENSNNNNQQNYNEMNDNDGHEQEDQDEEMEDDDNEEVKPYNSQSKIIHNQDDNSEQEQEEEEEEEEEEDRSQYIEHRSCPDLHEDISNSGGDRNNYSQNDVTRYIKLLNYIENQNNEEQGEENMDDNDGEYDDMLTKNTKSNDENLTSEDLALHGNTKENYIMERNSENFEDNSKSVHISRITEASHSKENSEHRYSNKKRTNLQGSDKQGSQIKTNQHSNRNNKPSSSRRNINNVDSHSQSNVNSMDSGTKKQNFNNNKNKSQISSGTSINNKKPVQVERPQTSSKVRPAGDDKNLKKNKSQRQLHNKSNKSVSSQGKSEFSMSSIHSLNNSEYEKGKQSEHLDESENIEELPLNDDNMRDEILKEFKKQFGNKTDKIFLNHNIKNSNDLLEIILRNLKLAKNKMQKIGLIAQDPDDLLTKEFLHKYYKEFEYIIKYYENENRKRNYFKQKALGAISKNVDVMKKIQDIESKKIETEINRRKEARNLKGRDQQIKLCNDIYSKALEFEKVKFIQENNNFSELKKIENGERRKVLVQIENYYTDKISMLQDILKKEKYERELQYRAQLQFFSKLEREKKSNYKNHIEKIFDQLDEQDRKAEFRSTNNSKLDEILRKIYNSKS